MEQKVLYMYPFLCIIIIILIRPAQDYKQGPKPNAASLIYEQTLQQYRYILHLKQSICIRVDFPICILRIFYLRKRIACVIWL